MTKTLFASLFATAVGSLASTAFAASMAYQTEVLSDSPYLYYRLGESSGTSAADTSGNSRTGTYTNSPTLGVAGSSVGGDTAVTFDGSNDYVATSSATSFGSLLDGSSFEFVLKTTTTASTNLFGTFNTGATTGIEIQLNRNAVGNAALSNAVRLFLRDEDGQNSSATFTNASVFDGSYHQIVLTYDSTNGILGYVDGAAQTMTTGTTNGPDNFADFGFAPTVAARNNRGTIDNFAAATIDEFAIYDGVLTSTQVLDHFNAIPEPSTFAMLLGGIGALTLFRRRKA